MWMTHFYAFHFIHADWCQLMRCGTHNNTSSFGPEFVCVISGQYQILLVLSVSRLYAVCGNIDLTAPESDHKIHFRKILALLHSIVMAFVAKCHNVRDHPPAHKSSISKTFTTTRCRNANDVRSAEPLYIYLPFVFLYFAPLSLFFFSRSPKFSLFD